MKTLRTEPFSYRAWSLSAIVCRIFAAWLTSVAVILYSSAGGEGIQYSFYELPFAQGIPLFNLLLSVSGFFIAYTMAAKLLCRHLHADALFLLIASLFCGVYYTLQSASSSVNILSVLAVILFCSLIAVYFCTQNRHLWASARGGKKLVIPATILFAVISFGILATISCLRYRTYSAPNFDFGIFCNMFANMKKTGLPLVTCERDRLLSHFAVHLSPVYYLLLPFYYLFPTPETLQIGQAAVLMLGVIPVILLCKKIGLSHKLTALFSGIYCFYPALTAGCFYDLHENCFLPLFLLSLFAAFEYKKYIPMYVFAVLTLSVKEDAAVYIIIFALHVLLSKQEKWHGAILLVLSAGYFATALYILNTYGEGVMSGRFENLILDPADGLLGAVKTALLNPGYLFTQLFATKTQGFEKIVYLLQLLLPLGFLPLASRKPSRWLLLSPMLLNLLTLYVYQYDISFQYHFGITAFLFYAALQNVVELKLPARESLVPIGVIATCMLYLFLVSPGLEFFTTAWQSNREAYLAVDNYLEETVPTDCSVAATTWLVPHLADRDEVYELYYHQTPYDTDYVVLMTSDGNYEKDLERHLANGYTEVGRRAFVTVLKKTADAN